MLLSRVADSLYWMGRYLERSEHTARIVDVAVDHGLGGGQSVRESSAVANLFRGVGLETPGRDAQALAAEALLAPENPSSVVSCVTAARENARQVREEISSPMWQQLNELYLRVRQFRHDGAAARTHEASRTVIDGVRLFKGIADGTMGHGEGWQFLQVGRFLERSFGISALLQLFVPEQPEPAAPPDPLGQVEWVALLQACYALEPYCRHYTADVRSERVTEFLLLDADFPRSIRFSAGRLEDALRRLAGYTGTTSGGQAVRLAGRLRASLEYALIGEILQQGTRTHLSAVTGACLQIHAVLQEHYLSYPIEEALLA